MHRYPQKYVSRYVMVSFTREPYKLAQICGRLQQDFLEKICKSVTCVEELDWNLVDMELNVYLAALEKEKVAHGFS